MIEGPIGVGKTSLARRMASHLRGELLLEKPGENPFLENSMRIFPAMRSRHSCFFCFSALINYRDWRRSDMFARPIVSDFMLDKDPLFARLTLSDAEYELYRKIFHHLQPKAPRPDW